MGKKVRSAKGELVDFDLMKIKEQIASAPPTLDVKARQDFIDKRLRRRLKKAKQNIEKVEIEVDSKVAAEPDAPLVEAVDQKPTAPKKKSKQKARPKTKKT